MSKLEQIIEQNTLYNKEMFTTVQLMCNEAITFAIDKLEEKGYNYQLVDSAISTVTNKKGKSVLVKTKMSSVPKISGNENDFGKRSLVGLGLYDCWTRCIADKDNTLIVIYIGCGVKEVKPLSWDAEFFTMFALVDN